MIKIDKDSLINKYKTCNNCSNDDSVITININGNLIRLCKKCRLELIDILKK